MLNSNLQGRNPSTVYLMSTQLLYQRQKYAYKPTINCSFLPLLKWLWYLVTAVHSSHCFRQTDHALKLSHRNPPWRLGYSRAIPLAETFILFHNEVLWLFRNLFQNITEVRAFLLDGSCIKHSLRAFLVETLWGTERVKLWSQQRINTEMHFKITKPRCLCISHTNFINRNTAGYWSKCHF